MRDRLLGGGQLLGLNIRRLKTTTVSRTFIRIALVAAVSVAAVATPAAAQPRTLSVNNAVEAALTRPALDRILTARTRALRAASERNTVHPTPEFDLAYEQVLDDTLGGREFTAAVRQTFDLDGWRDRQRAALPHLEDAARADAAAKRLTLATATRSAFYAVLYHQHRVEALDAWIARLSWGAENLAKRHQQGDASLFALRRLQREHDGAQLKRALAHHKHTGAWADLQRLTGLDDRPVLVGTLAPTAALPSTPRAITSPQLVALQSRARAVASEQARWGDPMLRDWTLGAGYRLAQANEETGHGFVLSLSLPLAFWNNDAPTIDALNAEHAALTEAYQFETTQLQRKLAASNTRLESATLALAQQAVSQDNADDGLGPLAEKAFRAGAATLTELLEVYARETELSLDHIELEMEARRAALARDAALGLTQGVTP
jgi:cobalt-zinc-cadmium efflux system outer membrane protein